MAKDLEYYLSQARRIAERREAGAEKEIRRLYKALAKDLQAFMSDTYLQYAQDDKLAYGMLQAAGYDARFLQEIEQRLNLGTPAAAEKIKKLVEDTYEAAYKEMVKGVASQVPLDEAFMESVAITPEQIRRAVENPVSGLTLTDTLEKNRKDIIYAIKQTVGVGLMNGDRYTTMAKRIADHLDGDYKKAIRIARTETHRVREAGNIDAAVKVDEELQNGTTGFRMCKTWKTMKDERVRPQRARKGKGGWKFSMGSGANHMKMHDQTVLAEEEFDLGGGVKAMAPGNSGDAGNDINCRCYASYEMMDDATYFAKTGKHFPNLKQSSGIVREPFEPANSVREAVDYTKQYANMAIYKLEEENLEFYNEFNRSLNTLEKQYPAAKLKKIWVNDNLRNSNMRANGDEMEINPRMLKGHRFTLEAWKEVQKSEAEYIETYRIWGAEKYKKEIKKLEERQKYSRWDVCSSYEKKEDYIFSLVAHEYGHVISDQYIGLINGDFGLAKSYRLRSLGEGSPAKIAEAQVNKVKACFRKAKNTGDIYNISAYAATDKDEFFSEVFSMKCCGEPLPDYIEEMLEEVLKIGKL